jgi:hypothetical protein
MDGAACQEKALGQRGLAGIGVRNDRKSPPALMVGGNGSSRPWEWSTPYVGKLYSDVENGRVAGPKRAAAQGY